MSIVTYENRYVSTQQVNLLRTHKLHYLSKPKIFMMLYCTAARNVWCVCLLVRAYGAMTTRPRFMRPRSIGPRSIGPIG